MVAGNALSNDLRHTLSHLELVHADDIGRFSELDVSASFTGAWAFPSIWITNLNLPVLGQKRVDRIFPIGSVHRAGAVVVGGSDWIYGPHNPLDSIEVAITRQDPDDAKGLVGNTGDSIDLATAIEASVLFTIFDGEVVYRQPATE